MTIQCRHRFEVRILQNRMKEQELWAEHADSSSSAQARSER
jgi:hypothetical protein